MWIGSKGVASKLFNELFDEVKKAAPCSELTPRLKNKLEQCNESVRSDLASSLSEDCSRSPLFL